MTESDDLNTLEDKIIKSLKIKSDFKGRNSKLEELQSIESARQSNKSSGKNL